ncbi:hypothetical protein Forpi1262_v003887 [Fusarium oxysporum f. sp. raphani]|uniref:Uncharacterized protein n=1 Tax=Fusarium oxysporum f. sp. raphani TaxID=96318 RepID=A0A8J5UG46_FUSOX|nr:hypothetical protein Forpi1262_v003887 [Fusarium oxysporum f. sp. raphani]
MPHKAVAFSLNFGGTVRPSSLARASKIWDSLDPFPPSQLPFPLTPFTLRSFLTLNSFIQHQQSLSEWLTGSFSHYHYEYQLRPTFFISTYLCEARLYIAFLVIIHTLVPRRD